MRSAATICLVLSLLSTPAPAVAQVCDGISVAPADLLTTVRVASGLSRPLVAVAPPGDVDRLFLAEQDGTIRILKNGSLLAAPFLDLSALARSPADPGGGNEEGLLGVAFHPDYETNGWVFVYHTDLTGANNLVVRYTVSASPDLIDAASRQVVLTISHPNNNNHNGGNIAFSPIDGKLYIGTGDGGGSCDPDGNGQDLGSLLGKMLRIEVDALPYAVPGDNPFVGVGGALEEIWAFGLRNPWRWAFDSLNGDLYIGDVGQFVIEEVDHQPGTSPGGENYGWDRYEGSACPITFCGGGGGCVLPGHVPPVLEFGHASGACSITGGQVYRGCRMPDLGGTYLYGDFCAAFVRTFELVGGVVTNPGDLTGQLAPGGGLALAQITSFGSDARGALYVIDRGEGDPAGGEVYKIVPILPNLEVSGAGAATLELVAGGPWSWEDLQATSSHPITEYRVYRSFSSGGGTFDCVHADAASSWATGDPLAPALGELFTYLVTARNAAGDETGPGTASDGTPRTLSAAACL